MHGLCLRRKKSSISAWSPFLTVNLTDKLARLDMHRISELPAEVSLSVFPPVTQMAMVSQACLRDLRWFPRWWNPYFLTKPSLRGGTASICKVFPYWCFNCPNFTRNTKVANLRIVKLMRVQNWTFLFANHQNWCRPSIPPTNAIPIVESFLENFSPSYLCVLSFCKKKFSRAKEEDMQKFAWGWTQIFKLFSKLELAHGKCTRYTMCKHCQGEISSVYLVVTNLFIWQNIQKKKKEPYLFFPIP